MTVLEVTERLNLLSPRSLHQDAMSIAPYMEVCPTQGTVR